MADRTDDLKTHESREPGALGAPTTTATSGGSAAPNPPTGTTSQPLNWKKLGVVGVGSVLAIAGSFWGMKYLSPTPPATNAQAKATSPDTKPESKPSAEPSGPPQKLPPDMLAGDTDLPKIPPVSVSPDPKRSTGFDLRLPSDPPAIRLPDDPPPLREIPSRTDAKRDVTVSSPILRVRADGNDVAPPPKPAPKESLIPDIAPPPKLAPKESLIPDITPPPKTPSKDPPEIVVPVPGVPKKDPPEVIPLPPAPPALKLDFDPVPPLPKKIESVDPVLPKKVDVPPPAVPPIDVKKDVPTIKSDLFPPFETLPPITKKETPAVINVPMDPVRPIQDDRKIADPRFPTGPEPGTAPPVKKDGYEEDWHTPQGSESYLSISKAYYAGSGDYARALEAYNKDRRKPGENIIRVPPLWVLKEKHGDLIDRLPGGGRSAAEGTPNVRERDPVDPRPAPPPAIVAASSGNDEYRVRTEGGEGIRDIARRVLGNADSWRRLYDLNPGIDPTQPIPVGTVLRIPR